MIKNIIANIIFLPVLTVAYLFMRIFFWTLDTEFVPNTDDGPDCPHCVAHFAHE